MDLSFLPSVNASLNGLATLLLVGGFVLIKRHRIAAHRACMVGAFSVSTLFLVLYVTHKVWKATTGTGLHTTFHREGLVKLCYLAMLLSHLVLAMAVPVLAIWMIRLGMRRQDEKHRRLARVALPIWLYVSVTGVLIYLMLYHLNVDDPSNSIARSGTLP